MNSNDDKKITITDLHFSHTEKPFIDPFSEIEIAGCPEHNERVRARRAEKLYQNENALTRQQLQMINENLQKQIDEAKKSGKNSKIISIVSIGVAIVSLVISTLLAIFL